MTTSPAKKNPQTPAVDYPALEEKLVAAIQKAIPKNETIGIACSGGLDSGILASIARNYSKKIVLVVVGIPGSVDVQRTETLAKKWKMKLVKSILTPEQINQKYELAGKILKKKDHLQQTLGAVNLSIAQLAHQKDIHILMVGSGADELFCGYAQFDQHRDNPSECQKLRKEKVENVNEHDVEREIKCAQHYGITLHAPYLDEAFAREAMKIPAIQNLQGKYGKDRKAILRTLGEKMNVPTEIIQRPKKAMQYGSGVAKTLGKSKMSVRVLRHE